MSRLPGLSAAQRACVDHWLPGATLIADHSWGLTDTAVLQLHAAGEQIVVKAGGPQNHHLRREIHAHHHWAGALRNQGAAAELLFADPGTRVLVTRWLPGTLVQGHPAEYLADTYVQAGRQLKHLHHQGRRVDPEYSPRVVAQAKRWLDDEHRISAEIEERLRAVLQTFPEEPVVVVPTHGDYQPRNWLVDDNQIRVIDFGRAMWRPAQTDLARLSVRQFTLDPALQEAFLSGYGNDPREPQSWSRLLVTEAIGTAVWAYQVGATEFEAEGHRMIIEALAGIEG